MKSRVELSEIRKTRRETEQVNLVDGGRVEFANLLNRQTTVFGHSFKVPSIVDNRDFFHGARAIFRGDSAAKLGDQLWSAEPWVGHGAPIKFQQDTGERGHKLEKSFGRVALQFRHNSPASQKRFIPDLIREMKKQRTGAVGSPIYD